MLTKNFNVVIFLFLSFCLTAQSNDEVLIKVGNTDVKVSEFKYIYEKNNGANADYSAASVNEYLDLYTKFKLKVEKAKEMKLDTISALKSELEGYRKQLASSYLIDKEVTEFLLKELYDRMKTDVEFSHIFIPVAENATQAARDQAIAKLNDVKSKLAAGLSFEMAAKDFSEDKTTSSKGGNMGYYTAKLPSGFYDLETAIYTTPVGQVSNVVSSKIGYHIVKVTNTRPARGIIEVAHILLTPEQRGLADSLYYEIQSGKDFDLLVFNYSQDKSTSKNGGKLPPFGINTYDAAFETAAYGINKDGGVAKPAITKSGWHIIKRISRAEQDSYELFVRKMKSQINKDTRFDAAKIKLIEDIKKSAGFKEDANELARFTAAQNEDFYSYKWNPASDVSTKMLFSLGGNEVFSVKEFADYCKKNTKTRLKYDKTKPLTEVVGELYTEYVNESAMDFEEKSLEIKYPDFKSLMREYEEGILLFEATKINVWDKANQDTVGLQNFYQTVKTNYTWEPKAKLSSFVINTQDAKLANKIYDFAKKNTVEKTLSKFNKKAKILEVSEKEVEQTDNSLDGMSMIAGSISGLILDKTKGHVFSKITSITPSKPKTLAEARGYVVADYQDYLEKAWMKQLNMEFNVITYKEVLSKLKK